MSRNVLTCAALSAVFGSLFFLDLRGFFSKITHPIGSVVSAEGTVRRLGARDLSWDRAQVGSEFSEKDTIATGEAGRAKLYFNVGSELELEPGTMVVLTRRPDSLDLNFIVGSGKVRMEKSATKMIKIAHEQKKGTLVLKPKGFKKIKKSQAKKKIKVPESHTESKETTQVKEAEIEIEMEGMEESAAESEQLLAMKSLITVETVEKIDPPKVIPKKKKIIPSFDSLKKRLSPTSTSQAPPQATPTRSAAKKTPLFVPVIEEKDIREDVTKVSIVTKPEEKKIPKPPQPHLITPVGTSYDWEQAEKTLQWNAPKDMAERLIHYEVTIQSAKLDGEVIRIKREKPNLEIPLEKPGRYTWVVRTHREGAGWSPPSEPHWFEIKEKPEPPDPEPLIKPVPAENTKAVMNPPPDALDKKSVVSTPKENAVKSQKKGLATTATPVKEKPKIAFEPKADEKPIDVKDFLLEEPSTQLAKSLEKLSTGETSSPPDAKEVYDPEIETDEPLNLDEILKEAAADTKAVKDETKEVALLDRKEPDSFAELKEAASKPFPPDNAPLKIGVVGGVGLGMASLTPDNSTKSSKLGFAGGALAEFRLSENFYFEAQFLYAQYGFAATLLGSEGQILFDVLELPLMLKYKFGSAFKRFRPYVFFGPTIGIRVVSTAEVGTNTVDTSSISSNTLLAAVMGAGTQYRLTPTLAFFISVRYLWGFNDLDTTSAEYLQRAIQSFLGVGYSM